jgi:hypothetical protein
MIRLQKTLGSLAPVDTLATRKVWHAGILRKNTLKGHIYDPI